MTEYNVFAPNEVHGRIYLGRHIASTPLNAVRRARNDYEPTTMAQELAIEKENQFEVEEIENETEVITE